MDREVIVMCSDKIQECGSFLKRKKREKGERKEKKEKKENREEWDIKIGEWKCEVCLVLNCVVVFFLPGSDPLFSPPSSFSTLREAIVLH